MGLSVSDNPIFIGENMFDIMEQSIELGDHLYEEYQKQNDEGCNQLLIDWAKERFWGRVCEDHLPIFRSLWNKLNDNGNVSYDSGLSYGDMDMTVWAETLNEDEKLIIVRHHCRCCDDNTTIFRLKEYGCDLEDENLSEDQLIKIQKIDKHLLEFRVDTCWPDEIKGDFGYSWGDDRDIKYPSLETFRNRGFDYGYGDGRDNCHVLKFCYTHRGPNIEKAHWTEGRIILALDDIRWYESMFDEESD